MSTAATEGGPARPQRCRARVPLAQTLKARQAAGSSLHGSFVREAAPRPEQGCGGGVPCRCPRRSPRRWGSAVHGRRRRRCLRAASAGVDWARAGGAAVGRERMAAGGGAGGHVTFPGRVFTWRWRWRRRCLRHGSCRRCETGQERTASCACLGWGGCARLPPPITLCSPRTDAMEDEERLKKLEAGKAKVGGGCGSTGAGRLGGARSAGRSGATAGPASNKAAEDALCAALRRAPSSRRGFGSPWLSGTAGVATEPGGGSPRRGGEEGWPRHPPVCPLSSGNSL